VVAASGFSMMSEASIKTRIIGAALAGAGAIAFQFPAKIRFTAGTRWRPNNRRCRPLRQPGGPREKANVMMPEQALPLV